MTLNFGLCVYTLNDLSSFKVDLVFISSKPDPLVSLIPKMY